MTNDKSINLLRDGQPDGIGNRENLKDWCDRANGNSFDQKGSKAHSRHDFQPMAAKQTLRAIGAVTGSKARRTSRAKMKSTTADNKDGSKRG